MSPLRPRTLEDLRQEANPAWLWDAARARIVWANGAGVAALGGESVFDLVDRPFDSHEPAIQTLRELMTTLNSGQVRSQRITLPGLATNDSMTVQCSLHLLADGRPGVLVVTEPPPQALPLAGGDISSSALLHLPVAVLICNSGGCILHGNDAAKAMLELTTAQSLAEFIVPREKAESLFDALQRSAVSSAVVAMTCRLGQREIRLTLARLPADGTPLVSAVMEDVTDRRALERSLQQGTAVAAVSSIAAPPKPSPDAFAMLAKSLQDTIEAQSARPPRKEEPVPKVEQSVPARPPAVETHPAEPHGNASGTHWHKMPFVPLPVRQSFERSGQAILIGRGDEVQFATIKAAHLLGYDTVDSLLADTGLWQHFKTVLEPARHTALPGPDGQTLELEVSSSQVPWLNGPAEQIILKLSPPAAAPVRPAAVSPAPAEPVRIKPAVAEGPTAEAVVLPEALLPAQPRASDDQQVMATTELKAMLDVASDGIIALDQAGTILSFSAGAEAIFGMTQAEVQGRAFSDLLSPDGRKSWRDYLAALAGPGLASVFNDGREFTAVVKQGGTVPLFVTLGKLQSPHSRASFCAVVRDITQWKRTEQELREAKEIAEHASRQKSEFLAGISHEIRTPLNAILGFSDVMRTERFGELRNEKYRAYANDIHASGTHLLALVNDLLDLSKVEAGKLELDFTAVNVVDALEHVLRLLGEDAARANVVVRKSFAPGLPRVVADLRALRQVLLNLLSNAIKYTDAGGQVIVSALMDASGEVVLRVKDSGIGMTAAQMQDALRPYVRVESAGRVRQGTGLGLPLSKALTEANRAQFTIASEPGHGTLAEVRFPATRVLAE